MRRQTMCESVSVAGIVATIMVGSMTLAAGALPTAGSFWLLVASVSGACVLAGLLACLALPE